MTGRDGARDFDFLLGSWTVRHRRLKQRLCGDARWEEFGGTMRARAILAGHGNFDENVIALPAGGYQACTLRIYNPAAQRWSIHWIDGRDPKLDPPMIGSFVDGVGTFFGDDRLDGRAIKVRFLWSGVTPTSARWEQAFSADDGVSWEANWVMDFERADGGAKMEKRQS